MMKIDTILTGNCIEIMQEFPENSIGMIITSPPYNVGLNYEGYEDNISSDDFVLLNTSWLKQAYRVIEDTGRLYVIVSDKMVYWFREIAEQNGWVYSQKLVWCKPNFSGGAGRNSGDWNMMTEDILLFRKGKRTPMLASTVGGTTHNWFVIPGPQSNFSEGKIHPAQLPLRLCEELIARTPGEPVLDPFAGSASVLVAAKKLGRSYLGIELIESVAEKATTRLLHTNPPLFKVDYPEEQIEMSLELENENS